MYAIVDCDNFFVSCERRRCPELEGKPVVVLSAGSAAVVARSNEAKAMGVRMSMPYFRMKEQFADRDITAIPGDHDYYKEVSAEVMHFLRDEAPQMWQYSIDEAFLDLSGLPTDLKQWGEALATKVRQTVGVPVSIGIAPTKTLAKIASHFAKRYAGYRKCCLIDTDERRTKALQLTPIDEVWGIGRRYREVMHANNMHTAYDLATHSRGWLKKYMSQPIVDTHDELCGIDCIPIREDAPNKSISNTRTFPKMLDSIEEISTEVSNFAAACGRTLRRQHTLARDISVFIATNSYRKDLPQYQNQKSTRLRTPTNLTNELIDAALTLLKDIYRPGYRYKRAGVTIHNITTDEAVEPDLFEWDAEKNSKLRRLNSLTDKLNASMGKRTIIVGSQMRPDETDENSK